MAINSTASSLAKEIRGFIIAGPNRASSNGRSGKNKYGNSTSELVGRVYTSVRPICYGSRLRK